MLEKYPIIMIVVGVLGISLSSIFVRYSAAPSLVTAAFRLLWTVLIMTPIVFLKKDVREELKNIGRRELILSAVSGLMLALHFATWFESLQRTTVAASTIIVCTEVIWVALAYRFFMKGTIQPKAWAAVAITLAGSVLIAVSDSSEGGGSLTGDALALLAAFMSGGYTILGKEVRKTTGTTVYTYIVYVFSAAALVLAAFCFKQPLWGYGMSPVWIGILLAVVSTLLGHSVFSWCLKFFSPAFISASKLCEPVVAGVFAAILFTEIPGWLAVIGGVIILAGVVLYTMLEMKREEEKA